MRNVVGESVFIAFADRYVVFSENNTVTLNDAYLGRVDYIAAVYSHEHVSRQRLIKALDVH